jgi:AMP-activated protein kinase-like protein
VRESHEELDESLKRIVDELKTLPAVPADASARVLARVDAARRGEGSSAYAGQSDDDDVIFFPATTEEMPASPAASATAAAETRVAGSVRALRRRFVVSLPAAIGYALAATLAGFMIRGALPRPAAETPLAGAPAARSGDTLGVVPVGAAAATLRALEETPVKVQFVLDARRASRVAVVGDFNGWDGTKNLLERDSTTGLWTALVDVRPGRHVYAFLVDGATWTLDPNAPHAKDADYGTEQSVMIVGMR